MPTTAHLSGEQAIEPARTALQARQFAQALALADAHMVWERFAQGLPPDHITVPVVI